VVEVLVVAFFGGLGSVLRGVLANFKGYLPWGILTANTLGTALAAWSMFTQPQLGLVLVAGLAGGLSTFSTFVAQTWQLLQSNRRLAAFLNVLLNLLLPYTALMLVGLSL
jgi:CrcB protein